MTTIKNNLPKSESARNIRIQQARNSEKKIQQKLENIIQQQENLGLEIKRKQETLLELFSDRRLNESKLSDIQETIKVLASLQFEAKDPNADGRRFASQLDSQFSGLTEEERKLIGADTLD